MAKFCYNLMQTKNTAYPEGYRSVERCERCRWQMKRAERVAAVEIFKRMRR